MTKVCKQCGKPLPAEAHRDRCLSCIQKEASIKRKQTFLEKYGVDNPSKLPEVIDKITDTFQSRYGVKRAMSVPAFRQKYEDSMKEKYGVPYYVLTEEYRKDDHFRISKIAEWWSKLLTENGIEHTMEFKIDTKAYDICIPSQKILLEIDPSYTHNEIGNHWKKEGLDKKYHLNKSLLAKESGYRCIHIFDWDNPQQILNLLLPKERVFARNLDVVEISNEQANNFLDAHHIQGKCTGQKICIGLQDKNRGLLQVMTFGNPRYAKKFDWELLRLCTKNGLVVVGGASKLFKYAISKYHLTNIISYCDFAKFNGHVYEQIGMTFYKLSEPNRVWSKNSEHITANLLRQRGYDQLFNTNYGKGTSNDQLMIDNGWLPVMDCGQLQYVYQHKGSDNTNPEDEPLANILPKAKKGREPRICAFCGKEFIPASNQQKYCKGPHIRQCPVCGKDYVEDNSDNLKRPPVACSYECRAKKTRQTSLEKYGTLAPGNNAEAREKARETMQRKFGVDYAMQSDKLKKKSQSAIENKYGVKNVKQAKNFMPLFELSVQMRNEAQTLDMLENLVENKTSSNTRISAVLKAYPEAKQESENIVMLNDRQALILEATQYNASPQSMQMQQEFIQTHNGIILYPYDSVDKLKLLNTEMIDPSDVTIYQLNYKSGADWISQHYNLDRFMDRRLMIGLVRKNTIIELSVFSTTFQDNAMNPTMVEYYQLPGFQVKDGLKMIVDWIQKIYSIPVLYATVDKSLGQHILLQAANFRKIGENPPRLFWMKDNQVERQINKPKYDEIKQKLNDGYLPVPDCGQAVYVLK